MTSALTDDEIEVRLAGLHKRQRRQVERLKASMAKSVAMLTKTSPEAVTAVEVCFLRKQLVMMQEKVEALADCLIANHATTEMLLARSKVQAQIIERLEDTLTVERYERKLAAHGR